MNANVKNIMKIPLIRFCCRLMDVELDAKEVTSWNGFLTACFNMSMYTPTSTSTTTPKHIRTRTERERERERERDKLVF